MKTMVFLLVFAMTVVCGQVFASHAGNISRQAKEAFKKEFPAAESEQWTKVANSNLYSVRFAYNNQSSVAYFDEDGNAVAFARMVTKEHLPYNAIRTLNKKYSAGEILKVVELTMDNELSYMLNVATGNSRIVLRIYINGYIQKIKVHKKQAPSEPAYVQVIS